MTAAEPRLNHIARLLYLGYTPREIAAYFGIDHRTVYKEISDHHLPSNGLRSGQARRLLECLAAGGDLHELCATFRVTPARISRSLVCSPPSPSLASRLLWLAWWQPVSSLSPTSDPAGSE